LFDFISVTHFYFLFGQRWGSTKVWKTGRLVFKAKRYNPLRVVKKKAFAFCARNSYTVVSLFVVDCRQANFQPKSQLFKL